MKKLTRLLMLLGLLLLVALLIPSVAVAEGGMPAVYPKIYPTFYHSAATLALLSFKFSEHRIWARLTQKGSECKYILSVTITKADNQFQVDAVLYDSSGKKPMWQEKISKPLYGGWSGAVDDLVQHLRDQYFGKISSDTNPII